MGATTLKVNNGFVKAKGWMFPFILLTSLFFFWNFVHNLDPVLVQRLRRALGLYNLQSSLIDSAVFIGYFIMALHAGYLVHPFGYKAGIIGGLLLFTTGCFLFFPASNTHHYMLFLGALFVITSGLTFLKTAANPYVTIPGPLESTRDLNFAQFFNGLAAMRAPLIAMQLILSGRELSWSETKLLSSEALQGILYAGKGYQINHLK